jgi:hypothetical protein
MTFIVFNVALFSAGLIWLYASRGEGLAALKRGRVLRHPSQWKRWSRAADVSRACYRSKDCRLELWEVGQCVCLVCKTHETVRLSTDYFECERLRRAIALHVPPSIVPVDGED